MDGWMDIIRVGVCVGMCKYWVIILDILAYGGAKCFRGMNPSLILLTSLILPVVLLFSAHHHPPPTTHSLFTMPPDTCCYHAPQWPTTAVRASPFFWIESKQPSSTPHSLSLTHSIRMIDILAMSSLLAQHRCHSWNRHATRRGLDGHGHGGRPRLGQLAGGRHNAAENRSRCSNYAIRL